ncbi:MAG: sensor histidine kinase [Solirubrobacteraceae bacterium]
MRTRGPSFARRARLRTPSSLRWRLTAFVAAVMLASATLAFVVVYVETGTRLQSTIDRDLEGNVTQLQASLEPVARQSLPAVHAEALRYLSAQPYTATSRLLFVLLPARRFVITNHPELFGDLPDDDESPAEQAVENREGAALTVPRPGYSTQPVPDVGKVRILERPVRLSGQRAIIGAGEPLAGVQAAQNGIARAFVVVAALSLLLALVASYFAGERVTAPLRRMASVAARVDAGDLEPRMEHDASRHSEVSVLADAFNRMLDRLTAAFDAQQGFIADASHELRTPLTVIGGQLEVLAAGDDPSAAEVQRVQRIVQAEIIRMSRLVDDLLVLTAAGQIDFLRVEPVDLRPFLTELWDGLELTAPRRFELGPVPSGTLLADPDRLAQALRNLARNAIEQTQPGNGLVRLEAATLLDGRIALAVVDDGPGIPESERERVFERLYRTDQARSRRAGGAGLGLAIVKAIAQAHGGSAIAGDAGHGSGARVELVLPNFRGKASRTRSLGRT